MYIYYDRLQKQWGHRHPTKKLVWGKHNKRLSLKPFSPDTVPLFVQKSGSKIGPLIGILTSAKRSTFAGNREMFEQIHMYVQKKGGIVFVFAPDDMKDHRIHGFWFDSNLQSWKEADFPYPDVVYNRIPYRKHEQTDQVKVSIKELDRLDIPVFNPRFFNKFETYELFWEEHDLRTHLPETYQLIDVTDIAHTLNRHDQIYLKPENGRKGDGIYTLSLERDHTIHCRSNKRSLSFRSLSLLWDYLEPSLKNKRYLIQQTIHLEHYQDRPFDFRILIQKMGGKWMLSGVGARLAGAESITTHVPKGGELLNLDRIDPQPDIDFLEKLSKRAAFVLERRFPGLAECSLDVGRDKNGRYWIFEANAKPMEFDEEDIEVRRMERLVEIFYEKAAFGNVQ